MNYLEEMFTLHGRTAVVTGGAGTIGTMMSDALLQAGANVVVWSLSRASIDAFLSGYQGVGELCDRVHGIQVDASGERAVADAFDQSAARFDVPSILINGVGGNRGKSPFIGLELDRFREVLDLNLIAGLVVPTKVFCHRWIEDKIQGSIINLTSMAAYVPLSGVWAYDAAKAATLNLTMATAKEFACYGIRINAIAPGFFLGKQWTRGFYRLFVCCYMPLPTFISDVPVS